MTGADQCVEDDTLQTPETLSVLTKKNLECLEDETIVQPSKNDNSRNHTPETQSCRELSVDDFFSVMSDTDNSSDAKSASSKQTASGRRLKVYECHYEACTKSYNRPSHLVEHQQIAHQGLRKFQCPHCPNSYTKKLHLERHLYTHGLEKPFPCSFCEKRFITRQQLGRHEKTHTKSFQCEQCQESFYKHGQLRSHINKTHTNSVIKCEDCGSEFTKPSRLKAHMELNHQESTEPHSVQELEIKIKQYQCDILSCTQSFVTWSALQHHIKQDHPKLKCTICNKLCVGETGLQMHMMIHDATMIIKNWKCLICENSFAKKTELHEHCKSQHNLDIDGEIDGSASKPPVVPTFTNISNECQEPARTSKMTEVDYLRAEVTVKRKINNLDSMAELLLSTIGKKYSCTYSGCYRKFKRKEKFETHLQKHKDYEVRLLELSKADEENELSKKEIG